MFGGTEDRDIGVTMDGLGSPGMMGTPRMGIWGHQGWGHHVWGYRGQRYWGHHGWFGVTRGSGDPTDGDLGSLGMVGRPRMGIWGHQGWWDPIDGDIWGQQEWGHLGTP